MTKIIATVATPPYWSTNKASFEWWKVLCVSRRHWRQKCTGQRSLLCKDPFHNKKNQGKEAKHLCRKRRSRWISPISRSDLTDEILENDRVCRRHIVSGRVAKSWDRYNVDCVPTLFLGHTKVESCPRNLKKAAQRSQRTRDCELEKTRIRKKRERKLEAERTAKKRKLSLAIKSQILASVMTRRTRKTERKEG